MKKEKKEAMIALCKTHLMSLRIYLTKIWKKSDNESEYDNNKSLLKKEANTDAETLLLLGQHQDASEKNQIKKTPI